MTKIKKNSNPFHPGNKRNLVPIPNSDADAQIEGLLQIVSQQKPIYQVKIDKEKSSFNFIVAHGNACCYLNSYYSMEREMKAMFKDVDKSIEILIVFGIGNGQVLEYAAKNFLKLERIFLVEPSAQILSTVLKNKEVQDKLKKIKNITFVFNKTPEDAHVEIANHIRDNVKRKFSMVYHLSYRSLFKGYYEKMQEKMLDFFRQSQVNITTVDHNIFLKTQNIINNLFAKSLDINELMVRVKGMPVIMVSAGPSLNKNIHLLEAAKEKAVVVAVGSAIKILHSKGILPHLRAAFSPYPDENTVFYGIDDFQGVPLLYSNTLDYMVVDRYNAPKARMVMVSDEVSKAVYTLSGMKHTLVGGGGTIANVTFDLLCRAGCSKFIFIGQDMCFTDNSLYASGSWADPKVEGNQQGLIGAKDVYGNDVLTSKAFVGIKNDFEAGIKSYLESGIEFINATEGGLPMENTKNMKLAEVLEEIPQKYDVEKLIKEAFNRSEAEVRDEEERIAATMLGIRSELDKILTLNQNRVDELRTILSSDESIAKVLLKLEGVHKYDDELLKIPFFAQVVLPELNGMFYSVKAAFQYEGGDMNKRAESLSNTYIGFSTKLEEYGRFLLGLLDGKIAKLDANE